MSKNFILKDKTLINKHILIFKSNSKPLIKTVRENGLKPPQSICEIPTTHSNFMGVLLPT